MKNKKFIRLTPFKMQVLQSFPFIDADFDALTNYELLCKVVEYLNITVDNVNTLSDDFQTLYNYVHDYFDNLDVQEEINNKLDEMAESGELAEIIINYIGSPIFTFSNVADMKASTHLVDGSVARTLGYYSVNDGGGADYIITDEELTPDEGSIIELANDLYAKLIIKNDTINVKQFGCVADGVNNDITFISNAINFINNKQKLYFPTGNYLIGSTITINKEITICGDGTIELGGSGFNAMTITANNVTVDGLNFKNTGNYAPTTVSSGDIGDAIRLKGNNYVIRNCNINNYIAGIVFGIVGGTSKQAIIENNYIKVKGINTGYINDGICSLGDDAIIKDNTIVSDITEINRGCVIVDINSTNNIVENNKCYCDGYGKVGVHSEASPYTIIKNNLIFNPRLQGITLSTGCICSNNYVETPSVSVPDYSLDHCAIAGYGGPSNLIIDGNIIKCQLGEKYGIRCNGTGSNNKIINNSFIGSDGGVATLIRTHTMTNSIIQNNTSNFACTGSGINTSSNNMKILNNRIRSATTGIYCESNDYGIVANNTIIEATTRGIYAYKCVDASFNNNIIGNATTETPVGIEIQHVSSSKIGFFNNNIFNNVTTEYNKVSYTAKSYINDYKQLSLYDSTADAKKTLTIDNGSVVIS